MRLELRVADKADEGAAAPPALSAGKTAKVGQVQV
jgi:hypothetical protein